VARQQQLLLVRHELGPQAGVCINLWAKEVIPAAAGGRVDGTQEAAAAAAGAAGQE
jgi:hypothetical protein